MSRQALRRRCLAPILLVGLVAVGCGSDPAPKPEVDAASKVGQWKATDALGTGRGGQTASTLPDGRVLVAGGQTTDVYAAMRSAEIFDPATGKWKPTGDMGASRTGHMATVLPNGKVLVTGGLITSGGLNTAEIFDPAAGSWSPAASMNVARFNHSSSLLPNGRVLVAGGFALADAPGLASAEVYDPAANSWTPTPPMAGGRGLHTATVLPDGKVLVAAGNEVGVFRRTAAEATSTTVTNGLASAPPNGKGEVATAELYDPAAGTWSATGALKKARSNHTATLLKTGTVLVVGGFSPSGELDTAELYDPAAATWQLTAPLASPRTIHTAALLPDGEVLIAGGQVGSSGSILSSTVPTADLYDPVTGKWKRAADLGTPRTGHSATVLANGQVLVTGGLNSAGAVGDTELFSVKAKAGL